MGFFFLLLFTIASFIRPGELFRTLAPFRIQFWLGAAGIVASLFGLLVGERPTFRAPQIYLMVGFTGAVAWSFVAQGWFGGAVYALGDFAITAAIFFLVVTNVVSLRRLGILAATLVLVLCLVAVQAIVAYHWGYQEKLFVYGRSIAPATEEQQPDPSGMAMAPSAVEQPEDEEAGALPLERIRALGLLHDPNDLAQALLVMLPFLALARRQGRRFRNAALVWAPGLLLLYGIYLTRSRGSLVGMAVLLLFLWRYASKRLRLAVPVAFLALLLAAPGSSRGAAWWMNPR